MSASRNARLAVVCILLTTITTCSRRHDTQDFLPSAPSTQNALQITNQGDISLPADGASTVKIEAQISPDANLTRTVRFHTTLGGWLETAATSGAALKAGHLAASLGGERQADLPQTVDKEADTSGRAAAFLQSTTTEGTAVVTVSVITKDAAGNVTDTFASVTREVSFVQVSDAIELRVDAEQTFADGVSEITLEAEISADSPVSWNRVIFETTLGSLDSLGTDENEQPLETTVPTDGDRIARARLTSTEPGTASVKATVAEFPEASVSRFVTFAGQNPDAIQISTSASEIPADGTSQLSVIATVDPTLSPREVTFNTSAGEFTSGAITSGNTRETKAPTDGNNQAIVQLRSDSTVNPSVQLTATITLGGSNQQSDSTIVAFVEVATSEISVAPEGLDFGQVTVGTSSDLALALGNHGEAVLQVTALTFIPADEGFSLHLPPSLPAEIQPNSPLGLTVRYEPDAVESNSAVLQITSNDPTRGTLSVSVVGAGVATTPRIAVDPEPLAFGSVDVDAELVLLVKNEGTADLTVTDIVSDTDPPFEVVGPTAFTVAPNGQQGVTVKFTSDDSGADQSAVLTISNDDPLEPEKAVLVTATAD